MQEKELTYEMLPTGKPHISFSELRTWKNCSWQHKLAYIDKIGVDIGVHMDFGTACHSTCEHFLKTGVIDTTIFKKKLFELWKQNSVINTNPEEYTVEQFKQFIKEGIAILPEIPEWFNKTFPEWDIVKNEKGEIIGAEHFLYEPILNKPHAFKGFVDCAIIVPHHKKKLTWLLDFKTCGWGWDIKKKNDELVKMQLILYKNFWAKKMNIDPKNIRCGFVLLKRTAKKGAHLELVSVSVGDVTTNRALKIVDNMLHSVKKGLFYKNRDSCKFCKFFETEHCK